MNQNKNHSKSMFFGALFLFFSLSFFPSHFCNAQGGYYKSQWQAAKEEAKLRARRAIAEMVYGYYIQYRSVVSLQENRSILTKDLTQVALPLVKFHRFVGYKSMGLLRLKATISRVDFIEAINQESLLKTQRSLTKQEYQDLRFMFPETITVYSFGACSKNPYNPGRRYIRKINEYKLEACVRLVHYLKGPTISAVSRLNNFFLTQDTVESILPQTLLKGAIFCISEPNKWYPESISLTVMITGADWIFSVASALEENGIQLSSEQYLKLKTRFGRYPDKYITFRLPDEWLNDPNNIHLPIPPKIHAGSSANPPLGFNELGEEDLFWK